MNRILTVFALLLIGVGGFYFLNRKDNTPRISDLPSPSPRQEQIQSRFSEVLPADSEKTTLNDISGGDGMGAVSRSTEGNTTKVVIYADLPALEEGSNYQAWLLVGDTREGIGSLVEAKGGWLLEKTVSSKNYEKILVSLEKIIDTEIEKIILEGVF